MAAKRRIQPDERFHNTVLLMKKYRDVVWSLAVAVEQTKNDFRECFGGTIDEFLDSIYIAGADLSGTDIEERAKCIDRSNKMLKIIDSAVNVMRQKNKYGEVYYHIVYLSYMTPNELESDDCVLKELEKLGYPMCRKTLYDKRYEAIGCLSSILWGFSSKDCLAVLDRFIK